MQLRIQLFAGLTEQIGASTIDVSITDRDTELTSAGLMRLLSQKYPQAASLLASSFVAVNQAYADQEQRIHEGDEIAVIPPVSGG
ncbi:hypothetical protein SY83_21710 [Paenibacillus swuensis]|uniref:Molybdopterin synthase sulfur carrier subunit n=1 Tax=Paenibacillus swuensis TaxID=1178515 RepID=A0A172TNJ4_9BACL|nr:hypothetical protein SY83_21710 [Paenibacillus swuensis]